MNNPGLVKISIADFLFCLQVRFNFCHEVLKIDLQRNGEQTEGG